jgi:putative transposase
MKKAHFSDSQILAILKQAENGVPIPELCREHGMSNSSFYKWRSKYGGMDASLMARMKELEGETISSCLLDCFRCCLLLEVPVRCSP